MNKVAVVLGVAAVATLAGCKDPDYAKPPAVAQNEVKQVPVDNPPPAQPTAQTVPAQPVAVKPTCKCPPGTKHTSPCKCGAPDCQCIVETKPVRPAEPEYTIYYVQNGDYLAKISKKFNVTISSIKKLNNMTKDTVRVGQKLKIPGKVDVGVQNKPVASAPSKASSKKGYSSYAGATKEYVVKNGDTLGGIAYSNGINIRQLKELNSLSSDSLKVGQKLKVPAEKVAKAAEKKAAKAPAKAAAKADAKAPASAPAAAPAAAEPAPAEAAPAAAEPAPAEAAPAAAENAPAAAAPAAAESAPAAPATTTYVVQPNEDIQAVAIRFGITTAEIRELNNLGENDAVKAGQAIKLPADAQQ